MSHPVISVENLSKAYRLGHKEEVPDTITGAAKNILMAPWRNFRHLRSHSITDAEGGEDDTLWALKDVSFEINQGDVVGIIGRNGAGKSTLLKVLSRITEPTSGRAVIRGRVSSLLEVGTGFHPELSGRDNIYMNGTILGMTKREIDRKFDEIVDFSGVEKFLDTPTKRYSSGMQVRLAFAVAAHLEPEILIVDEVLAVGDFDFQEKCLRKMQDVSSSGRTVIFVSHNLAAIGTLCSRAIVLSKGAIQASGTVSDSIEEYLSGSRTKISGHSVRCGEKQVFVVSSEEREIHRKCEEALSFKLQFQTPDPIENPSCGFIIYDKSNAPVVGGSSKFQRQSSGGCSNTWKLTCDLGHLPLSPGNYTVSIWLGTLNHDLAKAANFFDITIDDTDPFNCGFAVPKSWGNLFWRGNWHFEADSIAAAQK
ncbi:ABC transporter ATP-binding protein [Allorhodopirellula solitaria]|uniref:Teichoic acids export ATP-binding protein TagH n=1 Tax=Allorhodopirellula solitaria TaxID=2527987 RepID=A0A5C5X134_9BACT|nr:ABC transporter ATP-binding protein [Allorhodopirellula solitaria]TWT55863.1 Teichoic acids export ATP-binding protein TagH [Allorhodopirellula solitaria]